MNCCAVYTARERLNGIQEAVSSILSSSTRYLKIPRSSEDGRGILAFGEFKGV